MSQTRTVYSDKLKEALADLRPEFKELGQGLEFVSRKRSEIAPAFLKTYALWKRETRRPFVAFVAALDPSVPADRKGYRAHASYIAAQNLLQLARHPEATKRRGLTPLALAALAIKSFLPLCGSQKDQKDALQIILGAAKWREADERRLLTAIRRAKAVGLPKAPRLVDSLKATKAVVVAFERERLAS